MMVHAAGFEWGRRGFMAASLSALTAPQALAQQAAPIPDGFTLAFVGDIIYLRPSLALLERDSSALLSRLRSADICYGNFESSAFALPAIPSFGRSASEGPLLLTSPEAVGELKSMGFDLLSHANNHTPDWGAGGIHATRATLENAGLAVAGSGGSLDKALAPGVASARGVSVALVAATASVRDGAMAVNGGGAASSLAGPAALRVVSSTSGSGSRIAYEINSDDKAAILASIREAKKTNALVLFSLHTHQPGPDGQPPDFEIAFAREIIDAGADAFVAHGPHHLRGMEIYKGKPIFYSLGNFSIQLPNPELNPEPMVLPPSSIFTQRAFFESMIATARFKGGKISEIRLFPFELRSTDKLESHGLPQPVSDKAGRNILERLQKMSRPFGAHIDYNAGEGIVRLSA